MKKQRCLLALLITFPFFFSYISEAKDLYKILDVDKNASQREIQKAFHRLSLKYHPDKNPSKSAQSKFAEINNAYEVLSDEEKRKNYDLSGDEQGRVRGPEPHAYGSNFHGTNEGSGQRNFKFRTNDNDGYRFEQHSYTFGGEANSHGQGNFFKYPTGNDYFGEEGPFSFNFGGYGSPFGNIFGNFFGSMGKDQGKGQHSTSYGQGGKTTKSKTSNSEGGTHANTVVEELSFKTFSKKVLDELGTWAILFVSHSSTDAQERLQLLEQISKTLKGSIKVGYVDCQKHKQLCEQQHGGSLKAIKLRFYSLRNTGKLTGLDYTGEWSMIAIKKYCIDILPRFSKHMNNVDLLIEAVDEENSPVAVLLTMKKDTPAIWRALSGLFYGRISFFDVEVSKDDADTTFRRFQFDNFPAILGMNADGETKVLSSGTKLEQASSSIEQLKAILEEFEKSSESAGGKMTVDSEVPSLTKKNFKNVCGQDIPLCIIGIHKSSRGRDNLRQILKEISQKSLIRKGQATSSLKSPVSYGVVDVTKQPAFLYSFEKAVSESENTVLIAYKPKKGTYTFYNGPMNLENAETFVIDVLSGDLQSKRVLQELVLT